MNAVCSLLIGLLIILPCISSADEDRKLIEAKAALRAEIKEASEKHPAFQEHFRATATQLNQYPLLTAEQAFCIASRNLVDDVLCRKVLNDLLVTIYRPLLPVGTIPILIEEESGSFRPAIDSSGFPAFERAPARADSAVSRKHKAQRPQDSGLLGGTLLGPVNTDTYGPGLHSDATGRPFTFRTQDGQQTNGPVQQDGYGLGVHMDQYGRPVYAVPK